MPSPAALLIGVAGGLLLLHLQPHRMDLLGFHAEALKQSQPVVNVVMPDPKTKARRIERDEHGNIARIIEEDD